MVASVLGDPQDGEVARSLDEVGGRPADVGHTEARQQRQGEDAEDPYQRLVRRIRAGRILELAGTGLWEGNLSEMREDRSPYRPRRARRASR